MERTTPVSAPPAYPFRPLAPGPADRRGSGLDEIRTDNVRNLRVAWTFSTGVSRGQEAGPIVVGKTLHVVSPYPNLVYALDPERGGSLEGSFAPEPESASQGVACCDGVNRGATCADGRLPASAAGPAPSSPPGSTPGRPPPGAASPTAYPIFPNTPPKEEPFMSSLFPDARPRLRPLLAAVLLAAPFCARAGELARAGFGAAPAAGARVLRVAADPNNLPFSNSRLEGFENKIVALIAEELGAQVEYTWLPQRRGFFRQSLKEGPCDLVPGVPAGFERTLNTAPYYRSSYTFLTRADRRLDIRSFDDPRLRRLQIGVQMIGDDSANTPPAHALSARGIVENVHGYTVYGNYASDAPLAAIVDAVARGEIDVAIVWGPLAGYFAKRSEGVFALQPVPDDASGSALPCTFEICLGVRPSEPALRDELNQVLSRRRGEIEAILTDYGVPLADASR